MIIGTGVDIIEVERVRKACEKESFMQRVFTEAEREYIEGRGMAGTVSAAGIFAAKEAAAKALSTGFAGMRVADIEILRDKLGKPYAVLHGAALSRMEAILGKTMHISISHISELAIAQAVLEG